MLRIQSAVRASIVGLGGPALLLFLLVSCRPAPTTKEPTKNTGQPGSSPAAATTVFVSILPQAYFVQRVGGQHVNVEVLVGPGQSPASYEPTPDQMSALAKARVLFRIGVPFEQTLLPKVQRAFERLEICDTRQGITLRHMEAPLHDHQDQQRQANHDHSAAGDDPHIWLSPKLVKTQARTICAALCRLDPPHADDYRQNLAAFHADLDALDRRIAEALAPVKGKELFVFHPSYGYFADAYGLKQVPVEIEGKQPVAKDIADLIRRARQAGVKVIFVQPQFSTSSAEVIARGIGGVVVPLDPLAHDYIENLESMARQVSQALSRP